jgi:hypothetical protein
MFTGVPPPCAGPDHFGLPLRPALRAGHAVDAWSRIEAFLVEIAPGVVKVRFGEHLRIFFRHPSRGKSLEPQ